MRFNFLYITIPLGIILLLVGSLWRPEETVVTHRARDEPPRQALALSPQNQVSLVPATHPAVILPSRWEIPHPTDSGDLPQLLEPYQLPWPSVEKYSAWMRWCVGIAVINTTGSRRIGALFASRLGSVFHRLGADRPWTRHRPGANFTWLETDLDPLKNYTVHMLIPVGCVPSPDSKVAIIGTRFVGFVIDSANATNRASPRPFWDQTTKNGTTIYAPNKHKLPNMPLVEFVGDSTTAALLPPYGFKASDPTFVERKLGKNLTVELFKKYPGILLKNTSMVDGIPGVFGGYAMVACQRARCVPSHVAKSGIELLDYPDVDDSKTPRPLPPGMEYTYFRSHFQNWNLPRVAPPFPFEKQKDYQPDAIVINLGTNDAGHGKMWGEAGLIRFQDGLVRLVRKMRETYGPNPRIVLLVPFGKQMICLPASEVEKMGAVPRPVCKGVKVPQFRGGLIYPPKVLQNVARQLKDPRVYVLDTTGWLTADNAEEVLLDGLHLTYQGGRILGERVGEFLISIGVQGTNGTEV